MLAYVVLAVVVVPLVLLVFDVVTPRRRPQPAAHVRPALNPEAPARPSGVAALPTRTPPSGAPAAQTVTRAIAHDPGANTTERPRPRIAPGDGMVYRGPLRQG